MISVKCEACGEELTEPGGILISPPITKKFGEVLTEMHFKTHLCVKCYNEVCLWVHVG